MNREGMHRFEGAVVPGCKLHGCFTVVGEMDVCFFFSFPVIL
jgi:hypothetical protein